MPNKYNCFISDLEYEDYKLCDGMWPSVYRVQERVKVRNEANGVEINDGLLANWAK